MRGKINKAEGVAGSGSATCWFGGMDCLLEIGRKEGLQGQKGQQGESTHRAWGRGVRDDIGAVMNAAPIISYEAQKWVALPREFQIEWLYILELCKTALST